MTIIELLDTLQPAFLFLWILLCAYGIILTALLFTEIALGRFKFK